MTSEINAAEKKPRSLKLGSIKTIFYIVLLATFLILVNYAFGQRTEEGTIIVPPFLEPYSDIIQLIAPSLPYVQAALVLIFGYLVLNSASNLIYAYMRRVSDHATAAAIKSVARVSGIALLLGVMTSIFNVNPAAALTVGSFGGLVVGFATQTILSHVVAGVFLLLARPFTIGDQLIVAGQTGTVKEVRLMHLVLETEEREILIPSGTVVTQILQKTKPKKIPKPVPTNLVLDQLPAKAEIGAAVTFTGRLTEAETGTPIPSMMVKILDRDIGRDDLLASSVTGSDGRFTVEWKAKLVDWQDNTAEIYAKFEGNDDYGGTQTKQQVVTLEKAAAGKGSKA